jgi:hypothetical protein
MIFEGTYRRFIGLRSGKAPIDARITHQESLAVGQVEPANFEMTRAGRRFLLGISAAITGIAPAQAIPTTAPQWVFWNADPIATYFLEEIIAVLTAGTPGLGGSLWACLFSAPAQVGALVAGLSIQSASQGSRQSKATVKTGVTITSPAAPVWFQLDASIQNITAAAFSTGYSNGFARRDLAGALALQPGQGLGLAVMAPTGTTPLYAPLLRWIEQETDME